MSRHVLHVITPAPFGGLERVVECLASAQVTAGYRVSVAAIIDPRAAEPTLLGQLRYAGVDVHVIALPPRAYAAQVRSLGRVVRALHPDVVHTHGYVADVFIALLGRLGRPSVTTVHGFTGGSRKNRLYEWMQRRAFRRCSAVVAVSEKLGRELVADGLTTARVHVIPNAFGGVAQFQSRPVARAALEIPADTFSIGWVGRVSREKGLDVLIDALPGLDGVDWHLTVVGDGAERRMLQDSAGSRAHASRMTWTGLVNNASELLAAFDVLVISSRTEGTPMTLLEAMSASVPVVTTAVGGIPDVVSTQEALLVPPLDPPALARAIRAVLDDPSAAAERAVRARVRLLRDFSMPAFVERYGRVYQAVGDRHGA